MNNHVHSAPQPIHDEDCVKNYVHACKNKDEPTESRAEVVSSLQTQIDICIYSTGHRYIGTVWRICVQHACSTRVECVCRAMDTRIAKIVLMQSILYLQQHTFKN